MEWLWLNVKSFFKGLVSFMIATVRLVVWTVIFFFTGLQRTWFMRSEVVSVEFHVTPWRCDMEEADQNLAYIDKLCTENPDLACLVEDTDEDDFDFPDDEFPSDDEGEP